MNRILPIVLILFLFISANTSAQKKDKPRKGEGIQTFLERNKLSYEQYGDEFIELNKEKLGTKKYLKEGVSYTLPSSESPAEKAETDTPKDKKKGATSYAIGSKHVYKLFGKKYEEYTIKSDKLKGTCFFLSSGHGGPDPGSIGKANGHALHEDEYAYDITLRLARNLMEEGATVYMIIQDAKDGIRDDIYLTNSNRETCMGEKIPLNQLKRLKQRSDKINALSLKSKSKYKRAAFIHLDSRSKKQQLDVFFYYAPKSVAGKKLADAMLTTFDNQYNKHQPGRGFTGTVGDRSLYVLNNTTPVGVFAELGNIQNTFDQRRFLQYDNRQALANWMCRGFITDYDNWKETQKK